MIDLHKTARRPYQNRIITKVVDLWEENEIQSVMVESPTGSGKTFIGMSAVQEYKDRTQTDPIVVWAAMRRHLLAQAMHEKAKFGVNADIRPLSMFNKQYRAELSDEITKNPDRPVIMVIDECIAGESIVHVLIDGKEHLVPISDVVDNGLGDAVLSHNIETGENEWMPILSRTCTGTRQVFDVEIETENGDVVVLRVTDNHRFYVGDGEYLRTDELKEDNTVFVKNPVAENPVAENPVTENPVAENPVAEHVAF